MNCTRPTDTSQFFATGPWSNLAFSYETCGNVNEFSDMGRTRDLAGLHLRVSFPADSSSGYTIVTVPSGATGIGGTTRDGSMVRFFDNIMTQYSVTCMLRTHAEQCRNTRAVPNPHALAFQGV
jgi:hypothetical protein